MIDAALAYQRMLADEIPLLVMMADPDGTVNFFNRAWYDFTGQPQFERDVDANWARYIHPDDIQSVGTSWAESVATNRNFVDMEYRLREGRTGLYRWVKARATALRDGYGTIVQWIGTGMDVDDAHRANSELSQIAEAYQAASLPLLKPQIHGLRFSVAYRASGRRLTACGDWYDAFALGDGRTAISVGDVGGHGLEAATLMAQYRQSLRAIALRAAAHSTDDPDSILRSVEETIALEHPHANATAFFGVVSADRATLHWSSAGHVPPLIVKRDGSTQWLAANEPPLGWRFGIERTSSITDISDARAVVLYTDGLVEASQNLLDGMQQLQERACRGIESENLAEYLLDAWTPRPQHDDVAILVVRP